MSYSSDVKDEMSSIEIISPCCRQAMLYGLLLFGRSFSTASVCVSTEHEAVAKCCAELLSEVLSIEAAIAGGNGRKYVVSVKNMQDRNKILEFFGHSGREPSLRINRATMAQDCCFGAFLRGVFLSCGTVSSPEKNYHLEFVVPYFRLSRDLLAFISEFHLSPKMAVRKNSHIIYLKESESIEDVLTFMGAMNSSLLLMGVKVTKDVRNNVNRRVNFETANLSRTVDASLKQVEAVRLLEAHGKLSTLPTGLRHVAEIRLENPEASLSEICIILGNDITRSGVNHRLNKLISLACEIESDADKR